MGFCEAFQVNKTDAGNIGELMAATDLAKRGWQVFRPMSHFATCDLVIMAAAGGPTSRLLRVEVKTTPSNNLNHRRFDVLAIVRVDGSIIYEPSLDDGYPELPGHPYPLHLRG